MFSVYFKKFRSPILLTGHFLDFPIATSLKTTISQHYTTLLLPSFKTTILIFK